MRFHSVHVSTWALVASLFTGLVGCGDDGKTPVPFAQALEVQEGETLSITLQGENGKTFRIVEPPAHGTLAGEPPELTYVPHAHFLGRDSFTFALDDSAPAAVEISVLHTPFYLFTRGSEDRESELYRVERFVPTLVGGIGHSLTTIKFDPTDGTLYGLTRRWDYSSCHECLVTIDVETGAGTVVGPFVVDVDEEYYGPIPIMAFLSDGSLFGFDQGSKAMYSIDKETVEIAGVVDGAFAVAGSGMWVDEDDTIWVVNRWGEVFALAEGAEVFERVYEGQDLAEAMGNAGSAGDLMIRGDRNPVTGEYWGVATSWGGNPVSPILRFSIGRDDVEFHGILGTDLGSVFDVHGLAFAPR